jgi:diadenosine tetraphosphate (Ap4A) HIT family hydrolase
MNVVVKLERFILNDMQADKSNVATLGNVVPHLHWHVIPRFTDDAHFPAPVWGAAKQGGGLSPRQKSILTDKDVLIQRLVRLLAST